MPSTEDNLNQSTITAAQKQIAELEAECKWRRATIDRLKAAAEEKECMYRIGTDAGAFTIKQLTAKLKEAQASVAMTTDMLNGVVADREQWRRRAEALERAIFMYDRCTTCVHVCTGMGSDPCVSCNIYSLSNSHWKFDEARFPKEAEAK